MNKDIFDQFKIVANKDFTDKGWLNSNKAKLITHMEMNPAIVLPVQPVGFWDSFGTLMRPMTAGAVVAVMVLALGGISMASGSALPGDVLYPWKRGVNEKISLALKVGSQEEVNYQIEKTSKRLKEIAELSIKDVPDLEALKIAQIDVQEQILEVENNLAKLVLKEDNEKALEATVKLQATLETHQKIMGQIDESVAGKGKLNDTVKVLEESNGILKKKSEELNNKVQESVWISLPEEKDVQRRIDVANSKLSKIAIEVDGSIKDDPLIKEAKAQINIAQQLLQNAQSTTNRGEYQEAILHIQNSLQRVAQASAMVDMVADVSDNIKEVLVEKEIENVIITNEESENNSDEGSPQKEDLQSGEQGSFNDELDVESKEDASS